MITSVTGRGADPPVAPGGLYGCVEAGGTKFVLGVARSPGEVLSTRRIETRGPQETLGQALDFFREAQSRFGACSAFGIGGFGPIVLDRASPAWGCVRQSPKTAWVGANVATPFAEAFGQPVGLDTDVGAAGLAEAAWGAAQGAEVAAYLTVGTGIGGALLVRGRPVHGARHGEVGHLRPPRHPDDAGFAGVCPFHGDCLEGLASGPAILARWGAPLCDLPAEHPAHEIVAFYLAQVVVSLQAVAAPQRIVLGGGVMSAPGLLDGVRRQVVVQAAGYFVPVDAASLVAAPALGDRAGLLGALLLAQRAEAAG